MQTRTRWTTLGLTVGATAFAVAAWVTSAVEGRSHRVSVAEDAAGDVFAAASSAACKCPVAEGDKVVSNECEDYGTFKKCSDMSCQTQPSGGGEKTDKTCVPK